jgi:hypothetical protein
MSDMGWKAASQVTFIRLNSAHQGITTVLYVQHSTRQQTEQSPLQTWNPSRPRAMVIVPSLRDRGKTIHEVDKLVEAQFPMLGAQVLGHDGDRRLGRRSGSSHQMVERITRRR